MRKLVPILILVLNSVTYTYAQDSDPINIEELDTRIQRLVEVNYIPAIGLTLIDKEGNKYTKSYGYANLDSKKPATEQTMFRLGSITKMFAALAILKLRDEGRLKLTDKLCELVPDVEFENAWEENYPVRVQHLLNHTTGWDDFHGIEWMTSDPKPLNTIEGVNLHPHTKISRWPPGTRMAYSNVGAPVAAYVVEQISGISYEEYLDENFFIPIGLENTSLLYSDAFKKNGVMNYRQGKALHYYHLSGRAAGAMNSSPEDLLKILEFFLERGNVNGTQLISRKSVDDMESIFPKFGLSTGYGLCNFTSIFGGFVFQGHNGSIDNALATFCYLPGQKIGYSLTTSDMPGREFRKINELVTNYLVQGLTPEILVVESKPTEHNPEIEGYYTYSNPRNKKVRVIKSLFEPAKVWWENDTLYFGPAFGNTVKKYIAVAPGKYRSIANNNLEISFMKDYEGSMILHKAVLGGVDSFKPTNFILVYGKLTVFVLAVVLSLTTMLIAAIWLIQLIIGRLDIQGNTGLVVGPLLCSLLFLPFVVLFLYILNNPFDILFTRNGLTMTLFIMSITYGLSAVWFIVSVGKNYKQISGNAMNVYFNLVGVVHLLMAAIMLKLDLIGIQTWA